LNLEIEFEYDDTQEGVWSPAEQPLLRERVSGRWSAWLSSANPLFVQLGIAITALILGAASTAGLLDGRTAQQDRAITRLHLAPVGPFVVQTIADATVSTQSVPELLATPWTDVFDQRVTLTVVNDGPDPVSVLGATLAAPEFRATALTPASSARVAPGGVSILRGLAHFVCGDYPTAVPGSPAVSPAVATTAQISVRTADGRVRREALQVDRFSQVAEQAVCQRMPAPEVVESTAFTPARTAGAYTVTVAVANRASFPLRMALSPSAVQTWSTTAGLTISAGDALTIPPHGTETFAITASVDSCTLANPMATAGYGFDSLVFTDARDAPGSFNARQQDIALVLADSAVIKAYCGDRGLTVGGTSGR
jgi:hypothetical protein